MPSTHWAVVCEGRVELTGDVHLPEGSKVLVILLADEDERLFWLQASQPSVATIWDNPQDDVYAELLKT